MKKRFISLYLAISIFLSCRVKESGLYPLEVIFAGGGFEVVLCYAQVHVCVAHKGESSSCLHAVYAVGAGSDVLEMELLLIDGGRGE